MVARIAPLLVAALAIVALTVVEGVKSERWIDVNRQAAYCATLLNDVPATIGPWEGEDSEVEDEILLTAGAEGYVSRTYRNRESGKAVSLWLIVGHARETAQHTPDSCYPSSGFTQQQENTAYTIDAEGLPEAEFWTASFERADAVSRYADRVFWSWFRPEPETEVRWIAPENSRFFFGNTPALFKMYFTAIAAEDETADQSVCLEFARAFLPAVNPILARANQPVPDDFSTATDAS